MTAVPRRRVIKAAGLGGLAMFVPSELLAACSSTSSGQPEDTLVALDEHEAAVVEEATARLIPGPLEDASEAGHPGAREAQVTRYIDRMLGALTSEPPLIFAGGPFSDRAGWRVDDMARFLHLTPAQVKGWAERLSALCCPVPRGSLDVDKLARAGMSGASAGTGWMTSSPKTQMAS